LRKRWHSRWIEDGDDRAPALDELAPHLPEDLRQRGFEESLSVIPKCQRYSSLRAVSSFFDFEGVEGLEQVRRAIIDTARWFP
jgi:hypothetical protein